MPIKDGDLLWVVYDHKRKWLLRARTGGNFQTHLGIIKYEDIIGKEYGFKVVSNTNAFFWVFEPLPVDIVVKMGRATQIIYPQDIGFILVQTGICPGKKVVEAGTGSGSLTINLAYYIQPEGHVYSYDINEKSTIQAQKNLEKMNLAPYVTLKAGDVCKAIEERDIDVVMLDLATPWLAVETAWEALKMSGSICCFSPTIEQVKKNVEALRKNGGFSDIRTSEVLCRDYQVKENATRPITVMIGHTGFLTFAQKVSKVKTEEDEVLKNEINKENNRNPEEMLINPCNIGFILLQSGLGPNKKIVVASNGNRSITSTIAKYVQPNGHVYSYNVKSDNLELITQKLKYESLLPVVTLNIKDACHTIEEKEVDVVLLDLETPWLAVDTAWEALKGSGSLCCFSLIIEQVKKNVEALKKTRGFADIRTFEILCRDYQVQDNGTHPTTMIGYTGFLTFARKVVKEELKDGGKPDTSISGEEPALPDEGEGEKQI